MAALPYKSMLASNLAAAQDDLRKPGPDKIQPLPPPCDNWAILYSPPPPFPIWGIVAIATLWFVVGVLVGGAVTALVLTA